MNWILIIWFCCSQSSPAIPVRIDEYRNQAACETAANVWRESKPGAGNYVANRAACIPGGRWSERPNP